MRSTPCYLKIITVLLLSFLISQTAHTQCYPDRHSMSLDAGWASCQKSINPNTSRPTSHWIHYDFGEIYQLGQSTVWNLNQFDRSNNGLNEIVIDYSVDGMEWIEWGYFNLDRADESSFYQGQDGPDLTGISAKEILITAISNHGGPCYGINEIRIATSDVVSNITNVELENYYIEASPIPFDAQLQWSIISDKSQSLAFKILDIKGSTMESGTVKTNTTNLVPSASWPAGNYIIHVNVEGQSLSKTIALIKS